MQQLMEGVQTSQTQAFISYEVLVLSTVIAC